MEIWFNDFFAFFTITGLCFTVLILVIVMCGVISALKDFIHKLKWKYTYKHRFDKPPTAKCYCKDCTYHAKDNCCSSFSVIAGATYYTADNWFCWKADPRKNNSA